ncbi:hypothetical protein EMPG_12224 [Blastomyces silverae]|uniref:Uncharacterized protein n=1 Tax=Blastomyces silverae TaxID=2060906 RepID=A0A0H1BMJ8_9EURO|nr:hypothetical protein EMPG_12224 [Blastomyces silverae]
MPSSVPSLHERHLNPLAAQDIYEALEVLLVNPSQPINGICYRQRISKRKRDSLPSIELAVPPSNTATQRSEIFGLSSSNGLLLQPFYHHHRNRDLQSLGKHPSSTTQSNHHTTGHYHQQNHPTPTNDSQPPHATQKNEPDLPNSKV